MIQDNQDWDWVADYVLAIYNPLHVFYPDYPDIILPILILFILAILIITRCAGCLRGWPGRRGWIGN